MIEIKKEIVDMYLKLNTIRQGQILMKTSRQKKSFETRCNPSLKACSIHGGKSRYETCVALCDTFRKAQICVLVEEYV